MTISVDRNNGSDVSFSHGHYDMTREESMENIKERAGPEKPEIVTGTAPSAWASYLINGETEGLSPDDIKQADRFRAFLGGNIVSCEDAGFIWKHDACEFGALAADCQTYAALAEKKTNLTSQLEQSGMVEVVGVKLDKKMQKEMDQMATRGAARMKMRFKPF